MKVLFNTYPMAFHTPGGGEVQLLQYKKFLSENAVQVTLMDLWNPEFLNYNVVHYFSCLAGSNVFCDYIKSLGIPLFVSPNLWVTEETKHNYPYYDIRHQFYIADKVICNSDIECHTLANVYGLDSNKFVTVYNGVDNGFFEYVDPKIFREHFSIDEPFVLNVANIEPRKNQLNLIKAIKKYPELKLVLIGHERDPHYARRCFLEGGEQVVYLDSLPHDSDLLKSAYAACSVFALPSTLETPGLAALEAAALGAKVLITSEGSTREYFGEGATYVNWDNSNEIGDRLNSLISQESNFLLSLLIRANFGWDRSIKSLEWLYSNRDALTRDSRFFHGIYGIEVDKFGIFAWAKNYVSFSLYPSILRFKWRSVGNNTADIVINGEVKYQSVSICSDWSEMEIVIDSGKNINHIEIKTETTFIESHGDPRELAFAIRDVQLITEAKK